MTALANIGLQIERCDAKVAYRSRRDALVAAEKIKHRQGRVLRDYRCPIC